MERLKIEHSMYKFYIFNDLEECKIIEKTLTFSFNNIISNKNQYVDTTKYIKLLLETRIERVYYFSKICIKDEYTKFTIIYQRIFPFTNFNNKIISIIEQPINKKIYINVSEYESLKMEIIKCFFERRIR